jgi:hypothetical protein
VNYVKTLKAFGTENVILSGGVDLSGLKWTKSTTNPAAMETKLPAGAPTNIDTLFVNGLREIRAKFPNGDPLIPGGAGWDASASGAAGTFPADGEQFENTVSVYSSDGVLLSVGGSEGNVVQNFTVSAPEFVRCSFFWGQNFALEE